MAARATARATPRSFYSDALAEAERAELAQALGVEGVDEEIALLRLRLRTALEEHPEDLPLIFKGIELLAKVVATKYRLSKHAEKEMTAAMTAAFRELNRAMSGEAEDA